MRILRSFVPTSALMLVTLFFIFTLRGISIANSIAFANMKDAQKEFGLVRVGGTIGWIVSVWLVGVLIQRFNVRWLFYSYIAFMALTLLYALLHPLRSGSTQVPVWSNLHILLTDRSVVIFLISVFLLAVGNGAVQNFFSLYMDGIGAGEGMIGLAWAIAAVSEIPVMMYAGHIIRRIGASGLLKIAFSVYALRWLLFSFIHDPGWALIVQLLHGLSFAAFLTAGVTYLNERTPEGFGATAQAIFNVVSFGLGAIVGSLAGGYLYDQGDLSLFFRVFSLVTVAGLLLFWLSSARPRGALYGTNA